MLQLTNHTGFTDGRALVLDKDGNQVWVVVVKATYRFEADGSLDLHPEQEPVCLAPRYAGEPGASSLLREAELVYDHPGTDVTINGTAYAPGGEPVQALDVAVSAGPLTATLRVFGDRRWRRGWLRRWLLRPTRPEPFVTMPICWERAFGGSCRPDGQGRHGGFEPRNPIGRGFGLVRSQLAGQPLPNLEDPAALIRRFKHRPAPVGLGAVPPGWPSRAVFAGTYDETWQRERLPLWPIDFDPRHFLAAPRGLASAESFRGGETIVLKNLTPSGLLKLRVPRAHLLVSTLIGRERVMQNVHLDRVILEPDEQKLVVVWRAALNCGTRGREVQGTYVDLKQVHRWRS